jgi:hypothetical protein
MYSSMMRHYRLAMSITRWLANGGIIRTAIFGPIYRKPDAESLELVRMGSHSELGL